MRVQVRRSPTSTEPNAPAVMPTTRSPGAMSVTAEPTASTVPAASPPSRPTSPVTRPRPVMTSRKLSPAARTATRISPGSRSRSASGAGSQARSSTLPPSRIPTRTGPASAAGEMGRSARSFMRTSRGASTPVGRTASWGSPVAASAASRPSSASVPGDRSTRVICPVASACALAARPQAAAMAGSMLSPGCVLTARSPSTISRDVPESGALSQCWSPASSAWQTRCTDSGSSPPRAGIRSTSATRRGSAPASVSGTATGIQSTR